MHHDEPGGLSSESASAPKPHQRKFDWKRVKLGVAAAVILGAGYWYVTNLELEDLEPSASTSATSKDRSSKPQASAVANLRNASGQNDSASAASRTTIQTGGGGSVGGARKISQSITNSSTNLQVATNFASITNSMAPTNVVRANTDRAALPTRVPPADTSRGTNPQSPASTAQAPVTARPGDPKKAANRSKSIPVEAGVLTNGGFRLAFP